MYSSRIAHWRSEIWLVAFLTILAGSCGPDSDPGTDQPNGGEPASCEQVCAHVYDTCGFSFIGEDGANIERDDCIERCLDGLLEGNESCVFGAPCQGHAMTACLEFPSGEVEILGEHYCDLETDWPAYRERLELEVVVLMNQHRAAGAVCGEESMAPADPLAMNVILWCAARRYSRKMVDERFFDHFCPEGGSFDARIRDEGYEGGYPMAENIGMGSRASAEIVAGWMSSPGHCRNIMNASHAEAGVGFDDSASDFGPVWTLKLAGG